MAIDWDKLRVFKAVAEAGSFTHAGEKLNLSQSAISRQISALENHLTVPLFHRHARGLVMTEQGEMLYETTSDVFDSLQKVQMQLTDSKILPQGPLTVTTVEFIASTWLTPQIAAFKSLYPDIQMTMLLDDRVYNLNRREADVAIRLQKADNADLIERHMSSINFSLCAAKSYLDREGRPEKLKDFKDHTMIGFPQKMHTPFLKPNWIFSKLGIDVFNNPKVILINSMHARYTAVNDGIGISVLPNYIINQSPNIETLLPDLDIPCVDMYFVYPQTRRNSKRISVLKDFLFEHLEKSMA